MKTKNRIILAFVLALATILRFTGFNWDQNHHLHPDERFLTMVTTSIEIPQSLTHYFDPNISTMNPYNVGYDFYIYGTVPLYLTKIIGNLVNQKDYSTIHLVGRALSALFDLSVVLILFKLVHQFFNFKTAILSAFLYALMVLPIQQSHFFTVDSFLNFFLFLSFSLLVYFLKYPRRWLYLIGSAFIFGLSSATKISSLYFAPILGLIILFKYLSSKDQNRLKIFLVTGLIFIIVSLFTLRLTQPSFFANASYLNWQINPKFLANIKQLESFNRPQSWFPPALQWQGTLPVVFPLQNIVLWGLGLPLGIIFLVSIPNSLSFIKKSSPKAQVIPRIITFLSIVWIFFLLIYQGSQFCKTMRYFLPLYPFIAIISSLYLSRLLPKHKNFLVLLLLVTAIYPLSFISIYTQPTTRITASRWIYDHIPAGSVLANEHWDDPLPLNLNQHSSSIYPGEMLSLYDPDSEDKWRTIANQLGRSDYIILSSNRLYAPIGHNPDQYPIATKYYQSLFDGSLGFQKVAQFTSYPCFPPLSRSLFCLNDDKSEEAFTVYDHPKVMIFQKTNSFSPEVLY